MPMKKKPGKKLTRKPRKPKNPPKGDFGKGFDDGLAGKSPMLTSDKYIEGYRLGRARRRADMIYHNHGVLNPRYPEYLDEEFK